MKDFCKAKNMKNPAKIINKEKGIAVLITMMIISIVMLVATLIASVVSVQLKLASDIGDSITAIYAADSGIEYKLYQIRKEGILENMEFSLSNGATVSVTVLRAFPNLTIKSLGSYLLVKRQFEADF
ncbi:pilus assembly PilX N-terminal domain-containing protein [Patescibacteria group bacterium]|nr:pilus assembly PilX N-terminal domain-containing protein [Patescibacteria group bacterium]